MNIYIDLVFFINFFYDLLLLMTVGIVLKRKVKFYKYLFSAFIGGLSVFLLFIQFNNSLLFLLKIIISILMVIIAFKFINIKYTLNNLVYLYMCSIILAGFLYFLNIQFSYDHLGILFIFKGVSINYVLLLMIAPIILWFYIKSSKKLRNVFNNYYKVEICFDNYNLKLIGFLDSGNNLKDPISNKAIIIVNKKRLLPVYNIRSPMFVPYNTVNGSAVMKCFKPSYILINHHKIYNYLIGETEIKFNDGIGCLLNNKLLEDNYV